MINIIYDALEDKSNRCFQAIMGIENGWMGRPKAILCQDDCEQLENV